MRHHHLSEYLNILPEHTDSSLSVTTFHVSTLTHHWVLQHSMWAHWFITATSLHRQKHSTQQAIITLVDKITKSLDSGDIVYRSFFRLKKAFDTVNHKILLKKLFAYGIRGNILKWFEKLSNKHGHNLLCTITYNQRLEVSNVGYHKAQFWVHYFLLSTWMIYVMLRSYCTPLCMLTILVS